MALRFDDTADGLIQRFQNNDISNDTWTIDEESWASLQGWTASQGRDVVNAAELNTSLRTFEVWATDPMTDGDIDVLSIVLGRLRHLTRCNVYQDTSEAPIPLETLDKLYGAIAKCPSDLKHLDCCGPCVTARSLLALASSFPNLETFDILGPRHSPQECQACALAADELPTAFSVAVSAKLPHLRRVEISAIESHPTLPIILSSLHTSLSVREVGVTIPRGDVDLVRAARSFCTCTKSVELFVVRGKNDWYQDETAMMADLTAFFDIGPIPSFSPTVTRMEFFKCDFGPTDADGFVRKAVTALRDVEFLRFGRCRLPSAMVVVEGLPRLTKFSCLSRTYVSEPYESIVEGDYSSTPYVLIKNQVLEDLCHAVERQGSMLNDIELDLISSNGESFPAIARLMAASRGRLVLNFRGHNWKVVAHLVEGARLVRRDLTDLRLRFLFCGFEDPNYADIIQSFVPNQTLAQLEIGFDPYAVNEATELSSAAIVDLIDSNSALRKLSLRGLRLNGATEILDGTMPVLTTKNRSLRTLELHGENLDDCLPRARALAFEMLKENDVLSNLVGFQIPDGSPVDILLRQNRYGRRFLRANDPNPIGIWSAVLARISAANEVGVMYKFLRAKPGLVRRHSNCQSFPAISRLMGACRGQLVINVAHHSWTVASHLVEGAHRLRHDLKDLRLRFLNCRLEDVNYADIVHALAPSKTLAHLELGFDPNDEREATELSSAAIQGLIESNDGLQTLSLRELRPNGATEILERIMPVLATKNRTLRTLELHGAVGLTETLPCARARALALDVLKDNFVLSNLVGFDVPEGGPLDNLLLQNRYGRIFLKANDPNPIGIWATVLARVSHDQQIGVMYKFLRAKPGLVRRRQTLPASAAPAASSSYGDGVVVGQKRRRSATE